MTALLSLARYSYHALSPRQQTIWRMIRWAVPRLQRWFFEGQIEMPGQLWYADRQLLYQTIRARRPQTLFEVGTWQGGGSTLFIAQALFENSAGRLHTVELDAEQYARAVANYHRYRPELLPFIEFHQGSSTEVYPPLLQQEDKIDFLFLDGLGAEQSLAEYNLFAPYLKAGATLIAHDWLDVKMSLLRPVLEADASWQIDHVLRPPQSVGLAVLRKRAA